MITVILTQDVDGTGRAGDIVEVSDGFARNGLLRPAKAIVATEQQVKQYEESAERRASEQAQKGAQAEHAVGLLNGKTITIIADKHDGDKLFAAIDADVIAKQLSELIGEDVSASVVVITSVIKTIGDHDVILHFGPGAEAKVRVKVIAE